METVGDKPQPQLKIYFLPNLMTAGNLFCGFVALTKIVEARGRPGDPINYVYIKIALGFILLACIFDLLDGRLARMGGVESAFGREFDSLADLISFGAAPAFLVHRVVLHDVFIDHPEIGWFISSIYLICGALRLARFNCLAAMAGGGGGKEFLGFPIPAAAGLVASVTLFLMWGAKNEADFTNGPWRLILPGLMIFLSLMMVSEVKYPSFKTLDLKARRTFPKMVVTVIFIGFLLVLRGYILPVILPIIFTIYLCYGFIRPRISHKVRHEIEEEDDDDDSPTLTP
ncbi:MAG TPA: CDP-diacylglycerol--serine O-phosphatidyltransferase [Verrucomicrobiae bacterium]|jgi:CDP-diacylglycerol--serine O-phosphatidyltransferase|nr:CDP-diacylglycerol--serine O-phosphatidyltransferase [Verrucomicrobiae bacterium]